MKASLLKEDGVKAVYLVEGVSPALLNALRRAVLSDLPAFAIDEVEFYENTSPLFNEYVASRIGLVPLTFDDVVPDDAKPVFTLEAEAGEEPRTVYSRELTANDEFVKVHCENIPLIKLGKGRRLRLQATAAKGTQKKHAKFQSALASYGALPEFKLAEKCRKCGAVLKPAAIAGKLSKNVLSQAPEACSLCFKCEAKSGKALDEEQKGGVVFFVESFNNVPAAKQFARGIELVEKNLEGLKAELKKNK